MATVRVVDLVNRARTVLQDTTGTRWPVLELQDWLNDSYKEIILIRPDANTQSSSFACSGGTRQKLTPEIPNALRLMDVTRNLASSSSKRAIRLVDRRILDDQRPGWHSEPQTLDIQHYMFDPRVPKEFFVYPPALPGAEVEVVYSSVPSAHSLTEQQLSAPTTEETIRIDDYYANSMLDYILYRAYSKDADYSANAERALAHYNTVRTTLDLKLQVDAVNAPKPKAAEGFTVPGRAG